MTHITEVIEREFQDFCEKNGTNYRKIFTDEGEDFVEETLRGVFLNNFFFKSAG